MSESTEAAPEVAHVQRDGKTADTPAQWEMWAGRMTDRGRLHVSSHPRTVEMYGDAPVAVVVTEDPEGDHYGWLGAAYLHYPADDSPKMVQPHKGMFAMQFPYGPEAEQARGHGRVVRLRVTDAEPGETAPTP